MLESENVIPMGRITNIDIHYKYFSQDSNTKMGNGEPYFLENKVLIK